MPLLELPTEILQLIVDIAVQHTELHNAAKYRQTCRQFDVLAENSILRLPKEVLLSRKMGQPMMHKLIRSKMSLGNADELLLCYTINRTADYLSECTKSELRGRYVEILEMCASKTTIHWRLIDCITTEKRRHINGEEIKKNALIAAVAANEMDMVEKLLNNGVSAAVSTPFFGEALATAASSGSLPVVQLLLDHWNWQVCEHRDCQSCDHLSGIRIMHAIEAAAADDREDIMLKLLDHKDYIPEPVYDDAIIHMVERNHTVKANHLLDTRRAHPVPETETEFWLRLIRTAAEYNRLKFMERILTRDLPDIGEASFGLAMEDACSRNHSKMVHIILSHLTVCEPTYHAGSLFWAAWFGSLEVLSSLLNFLQKDQRAVLFALAGAVSGKRVETITYLLDFARISTTNRDAPTRFTDILRLMIPDIFLYSTSHSDAELSAPVQVQKLCTATSEGKLADVISIFNTTRAQHPDEDLGDFSDAISIASRNKHLDILLFLCENWNPYLLEMWTPYLVASCAKSAAGIQIFTDFGWDVNQVDVEQIGVSSHYPRLGSFTHDEHISRWLLDKGASADARGEWDMTPTTVAISHASTSTIKLFLDRSSGICRGQLLHFAAQRKKEDRLEILELLLDLGCPIDSIMFSDDLRSWLEWGVEEAGTALFNAAQQGKDDVVDYLLSRGADATVVSTQGRTPLEVAEMTGKPEIIQLLSK